jgi:hypothetical protein
VLNPKDLNESVKAYQKNETLTLVILAEVLVFGAMLLSKITGLYSISWPLMLAMFWMPIVLVVAFAFLKSLYISVWYNLIKAK